MNDLHFAVVIGINRYPSISDLSYARNDAEAFRNWLISTEGGWLPEENVVLLTAAESEEAQFTSAVDARPKRSEVDRALRGINQAIRERVAKNAADWGRSRLYFYVSGHGIAPPLSQGAALMADASPDVLGECIELTHYGQWYEGCGLFRELVILADCCRERIPDAPLGTFPPFNLCAKPHGRTNKVVGYATGETEQGFEPTYAADPDQQRGFFTRAVLEGLEGSASVDADEGGVTSETLAKFAGKRVEDLTKDAEKPQIVQFLIEVGKPILLSRREATPRSRWNVTITLPAHFAGEVELRRGDRSLVERRIAGTAPWKVELEEGLYGVHPVDGGAQPFENGGLFEVFGGDASVDL